MGDETEDSCARVLSAAPGSCATCAQVMEFINIATNSDMISLGPVSSLIDTKCAHRDWIMKFRADAPGIRGFFESTIILEKFNSSILLTLSIDGLSWRAEFSELVHPENATRRDPGTGCILDPSWIDEGVILNWKKLCEEHHGDVCEHPAELQRFDAVQPTWLIDTTEACLVPGRGGGRYITLSYTRGDTAFLSNEKSIIDQLRKPGVLRAGALAEKIPRTVRNAIDVVPLLGERYLWVDSLCIVQDDMETLQVELDAMARIYSTSYLTIIAADGTDSSYGLRGFKGLTPQRNAKQKIIPLAPPDELITPITRKSNESAYYSRAWTYQEFKCSKRRLIFEHDIVYWECSSSNWSEESIPNDLTPVTRYSTQFMYPDLFSTSSLPDLWSLTPLIHEFNQKVLTNPDEALLAFSGIQWALSQKYLGGLLYGIPELFFEMGLMWIPAGKGKRRTSTRRSHLESRLPSWSFLGWQVGAIFQNGYEFVASCAPTESEVKGVVRPVTTWYTMGHPASSDKRRIESNWYKYKSLAQDTTQKPLEGWDDCPFGPPAIGYNRPANTVSYSGDGQEYGYFHPNYLDRLYRYPVPVLDATTQYPLQPQTQFLSCKTSRAFIHCLPKKVLRQRGNSYYFESAEDYKKGTLHDPDGNTVGFLTLMNGGDGEGPAEMTPPGMPVELVAISEGWFGSHESEGSEDEAEFKIWRRGFQCRECYHVLYVDWEEGIAYRKGVGCVLKEAWEKLKEAWEKLKEKVLVDLILG